jgi:Major royal jelly protein
MKKILSRALGIIAIVLIAGLLYIKLQHGGGKLYPDVSTATLYDESKLEILVNLEYPPGNVSISGDGRIFFAYHPFAQTSRFSVPSVFELVGSAPKPYPNVDFQKRYQGVFGMTVDKQNRLWMIEPSGLDHEKSRLIAFDLKTNEQVFEFLFASKEAQFAQDLRVTADGKTIILADTGLFKFTSPSLIVFDVETKTYRKLLTKDKTARPQDWLIRTATGVHQLGFGLVSFSVGIDGIDFSNDGNWLYYGAMSHDRLYKVPVASLLDTQMNEENLLKQIVEVGKKPLSDGIAVDSKGDILITDVENGGIARMDSKGNLQTLIKSPKIVWADGIVVTPEGNAIFTDSAIPSYIDQLARPPSVEKLRAGAPYKIYRFKP